MPQQHTGTNTLNQTTSSELTHTDKDYDTISIDSIEYMETILVWNKRKKTKKTTKASSQNTQKKKEENLQMQPKTMSNFFQKEHS